jgi:hypothetical protein
VLTAFTTGHGLDRMSRLEVEAGRSRRRLSDRVEPEARATPRARWIGLCGQAAIVNEGGRLISSPRQWTFAPAIKVRGQRIDLLA